MPDVRPTCDSICPGARIHLAPAGVFFADELLDVWIPRSMLVGTRVQRVLDADDRRRQGKRELGAEPMGGVADGGVWARHRGHRALPVRLRDAVAALSRLC